MRHFRSRVLNDPKEIEFRARSIVAGCALALATCAGVGGYLAATLDRPHRAALAAILAAAAVLTPPVLALPRRALVSGPWREAFFVGWSLLYIAAFFAAIALDGDPHTPLAAGLFLLVIFCAMSYPVTLTAAISAIILAGYAGLAALVLHPPLAYAAFFECVLTLAAVMAFWEARDRRRQREALAVGGAIVRAALDCVISVDADGRVLDWNPAAERTFGISRVFAVGKDLGDLIVPPATRNERLHGFAAVAGDQRGAVIDGRVTVTVQRAGGERFPAELTVTRIDGPGEAAFCAHVRDVTDRHEAEQALRAAHARAETYLDVAGTMIVVLDTHGHVVRINRKGLAVLGRVGEDLAGENWFEVASPEGERAEVVALYRAWIAAPEEHKAKGYEGTLITRAGELRRISWTSDFVRDEYGEVCGSLHSGIDVTEQRMAEERIAHLAYHDPLTGLANRAQLAERLDTALASARERGGALALLELDLDGFKLVNDSFGHTVGDEVLRVVSVRMQNALRPGDLLARHGGDEFLVLLDGLEMHGTGVADDIARRLVEVVRRPIEVAGTTFGLDATVGISLFPHDAIDPEGLLGHADSAMYAGKRSHRGSVAHYQPTTTDSRGRLALTHRMHEAVARGELELFFQPLVWLRSGELNGAEALVRWRDPRRGLVSPSEFIPLAEETGLIEEIGHWVLDALCEQAIRWREEGLEPMLSFNLSLRQLRDPDLPARIAERVLAHRLPPRRFTVEITESAAMHDPDRVPRILHDLHDRGFGLAIDDFGSGYSSLGRLREMPVDALKIDRSLLREVPRNAAACAIVSATLQLARSLGAVAVAEGVETEEQRQFLLERECDFAQGFLLGRPLGAADFTALLSRAWAEGRDGREGGGGPRDVGVHSG